MPYDTTADLPAYVKKLPSAKQQQWKSVFNSCMADGGDDAKCFKVANGVVKKEINDFELPTEGDGADFAVGEELEAAEKLYMTPDVVIGQDILSGSPSTAPRIKLLASIAEALGIRPKKSFTPGAGGVLCVVKQADGRLRWFARYSNAWEDRDHEILTEEAHKEYIAWAYDTKTFPELWLWHTGGTRFGEADWLDFSNGFAHASGLIDDGKESVVDRLKTQDAGVSHGFLSLQQGKYINRYRTYEISVLPRERAAVETSGFNILDSSKQTETDMAFTPERRKWLVDTLGEEAVVGLEKSTDSMAEQLRQLGTEYKSAEETKQAQQETQTEGFKALAQQITDLTQTVAALAGVVGNIKKDVIEVKKPDDEKIEDAFLAKVAKAFGQQGGIVRPTEDNSNVDKNKATEPKKQEPDFFSTMLAEQFAAAAKSGGNDAPTAVGTPATGTVTVE